jgi:transposase
MSKYSKQFKLKVVKGFLKSGGLKRVGHLFEISHSDVRKWTLAYQAHGHSGLNPSHQRHSPQFKVQVLQYMAQHQISARPAAAHFGIGSMTTFCNGKNSTIKVVLQPLPIDREDNSLCPNLISKHYSKAYLRTHARRDAKTFRVCRSGGYLPKKLEALAQSKAVKENKPK